jgi:hypothetical protein
MATFFIFLFKTLSSARSQRREQQSPTFFYKIAKNRAPQAGKTVALHQSMIR